MKKQPYKIGDLLVCIVPKVGNPEFDLQIGKIYKGLSDIKEFGRILLSGPGASSKLEYNLSRFYPASLIGKGIAAGDLVMCVDADSMAPDEMKIGDILRVSETQCSSARVEVSPGLHRNYRLDRFIKLYEAGKDENNRDAVFEMLQSIFQGAQIVEEKAEAKTDAEDVHKIIDGLADIFSTFFEINKEDLLNEVYKDGTLGNRVAPLDGRNGERVDNTQMQSAAMGGTNRTGREKFWCEIYIEMSKYKTFSAAQCAELSDIGLRMFDKRFSK